MQKITFTAKDNQAVSVTEYLMRHGIAFQVVPADEPKSSASTSTTLASSLNLTPKKRRKRSKRKMQDRLTIKAIFQAGTRKEEFRRQDIGVEMERLGLAASSSPQAIVDAKKAGFISVTRKGSHGTMYYKLTDQGRQFAGVSTPLPQMSAPAVV